LKNEYPDICMLVGNGVTQDPRVRKEAETLVACGYSLSVLGFKLTNQELVEDVFEPGYKVIRVDVSTFTIRFRNLIVNLSSGSPRKLKNIIINIMKIFLKIYHVLWFFLKAITIKADVYHAHDLDTLPAAYLSSLRFRGKLVYDSHELYTEQREDFPRLLKLLLQWIEGRLIKKTVGVIAVNQSIAEELAKRYAVPAPLVLRNFMKKTSMEETAASSLVHPEGIRVLYHGGYLKGRGLEELIKSVVYWDKNINLYLRGFGSIEEYLRRQVSGLSLENRVIFLEPVPMERLIADAAFADIGIIPYKPTCLNNFYSMPNKLFEYMMAGLAVTASDLPEIHRLNEEVGFGLLFDPDSPESIAGSINNLVRDRDFLQTCRNNVRAWSGAAGNWETESGKLVDFYRDIFNSNQKAICRGEIN